MKLRIRGNSIRFRLTQSEVGKIKIEGLVEEITEFQNGQNFVYSIKVSDVFTAAFADEKMSVSIPKDIAQNWMNTNEVGIYETIGKLQITIEKDFTCLNPRGDEEDSDTFPNPQEKHNC